MDENILIQAFNASIGPDNSLRMQAHTYLQSIESFPGLIPLLFQISLNHSTLEIRQLSVIFIKNLLKSWSSLHIPDKKFLRDHLLIGLSLNIPEKVRSQFEEIAHRVIKHDYPWEDFIPSIKNGFLNENLLHSSIVLLYHACKFYEVVMSDKRKNLIVLIEEFFPKLISLLEDLVNSQKDIKFMYIQPILMIFWSCFYVELPAELATVEVLQRWIWCFKQILVQSLDGLDAFVEDDSEQHERAKTPQWMCKKWAVQIIHRFFTRYFNKNYLKNQNLFISEYFQSVWAVDFYNIFLNSLFTFQTKFIPEPVLNYYLKYITQTIKFDVIFRNMPKETIQSLLISVCLQMLRRSQSDEELFQDNPTEFIRKEADLSRAYFTQKHSAITLMQTLCATPYILPFFSFICKEFQRPIDCIKKEALMLAVGSISEYLKVHPRIKNSLEEALFRYIFPEFLSDSGLLKARAAWVYSKFGQIEFVDLNVQMQVFNYMCSLMVDKDLPVRYVAAVSLPRLLHWEVCKARLQTEVSKLIQIYLQMIKEIDSEEVMEALESVISAFPDEVRPFAAELSGFLISTFEEIMGKVQKDNEELSGIAVSTLNTIAKIIDIFNDNKEELVLLSHKLQNILIFCFQNTEYFESANTIFTCLLYYSPAGSLEHLYHLFEYLKISLIGDTTKKPIAAQYIEDVFPVIGNLIMKYPMQTQQYLQSILDLCFKLLQMTEDEIYLSCQVLLALFENYQGFAESLISQTMTRIYQVFSQNLSKKCKISCSQVLYIGIWNNPASVFPNAELLHLVLEYSKTYLKYYSESLAKVHLLFAIEVLFKIPLPLSLNNFLPDCFKMLLKVSSDFEVTSENGEFSNSINIHNVEFNPNEEFIDDDSDDDDYPFGTEPVDFYDSKFEEIDLDLYGKHVIASIKNNPQMFAAILETLSQAESELLNRLM